MKHTDILLFGGQSNMQGQTESPGSTEPVAGAWEYRFLEDRLVPLRNPTGEDIRYDGRAGTPVLPGTDIPAWLEEHVLGSACFANASLIPAFCDAYVRRTGSTAVAVPVARGSTCIANWLPGTPGYGALRDKSLAAIRKARETMAVRHIDFVWLQGESDAALGVSGAQYAASCKQLGAALADEIGVEHFGMIRVGHFTGDARDTDIMRAQEELCAPDGFFVMLTRLGAVLHGIPEYSNPVFAGHFSTRGLELLGTDAGRTLAQLRILQP